MAKKKLEKRQEATSTSIAQSSTEDSALFPNLSPKFDLEFRIVLEDQIILLDVSIQYLLTVNFGVSDLLFTMLIDLAGIFLSSGM